MENNIFLGPSHAPPAPPLSNHNSPLLSPPQCPYSPTPSLPSLPVSPLPSDDAADEIDPPFVLGFLISCNAPGSFIDRNPQQHP